MLLVPQSSINATCDAYHGIALSLCRQARATLRHLIDLPYGDHPEQRLDLYFPAEAAAGPLPVFLNIHGGGWTHGYKEWMGLNALAVTGFPAIYASLSYRLAPAAKHPAQVEDCLDAIAWLVREIAALGGDPDRIHIGGHSAGAHIATLAALRTDLQEARNLAPGTIKSCFGYSGLYDLRGAHDAPLIPGISAIPMLNDRAAEADASPIAHVRPVPTAFHISWGAQEIALFHEGGRRFADALAACGNRVETAVPDLDHFWIHLDQIRPDSDWNRALRAEMAGDDATGRRHA